MKYLILLILILNTAFGGFPQGTHEKMFKDIIQFKNSSKDIIDGSVDPSVTATPGDPGSLYMGDNAVLYIKQDSGTSTNWRRIITSPTMVGEQSKILAVNAGETAMEYVDVMTYNNNGLKNLFLNPSGEGLVPDVDWFCTNGIFLGSTGYEIASAKSTKNFSISGTSAGECVAQLNANAQMKGNQGVFSGYFNVSNNGISTIQVKIDGAVQSELALTAAANYKKYEIPFVFGDTSTEIVITYSAANTILMDELYAGVGKVSQTVGQAHFVGSLDISDCTYSVTSASYAKLTDTCTNPTTVGNVSAITNTAGVKVNNFRTDGYYSVNWQGLFYNQTNTGVCKFTFSETTNYESNGITYAGSASVGAREQADLSGNFRFTSSSTGEMFIIASGSGGTACQAYGVGGNPAAITVKFFPDSNATIVSQDTELTANEINTCDLAFNMVTDTIISQSAGCPSGIAISNVTTGQDSITIPSGFYTVFPNVQCTGANQGAVVGEVCHLNNGAQPGTLTNIPLRVKDIAGAAVDAQRVHVTLTKQGADYNKSATIVGKFENINDTPICKVEAQGNDGGLITDDTEDIAFKNIITDNCNAWDNSGNTGGDLNDSFTAPRDMRVNITGTAIWSGSNAYSIDAFIDGVQSQRRCVRTIAGDSHSVMSCQIDLKEGERLSLRNSSGSFTLLNSVFHRIQITEMPNLSAVVKNLATDSKIECQTKILAASASSAGIMADLTFNNLTVGKKYRIYPNLRLGETTTTANEKYAVVTAVNNSVNVDVYYSRSLNISRHQDEFTAAASFVAADTTLHFNFTATTNMSIVGNGSKDNSFIELCELPDTYIEGSKW